MASAAIASIVQYLAQSRDLFEAAINNPVFLTTAEAIVDRLVEALVAGGKVLLVGNGGSAADAQHLAGEFLSRLNYDRAPALAIALTADSSVLTAIGKAGGTLTCRRCQRLCCGSESCPPGHRTGKIEGRTAGIPSGSQLDNLTDPEDINGRA